MADSSGVGEKKAQRERVRWAQRSGSAPTIRFPDKPRNSRATPQSKKIMAGYIRRKTVEQYGDFTDETLSLVTSIGDRQVRNIRRDGPKSPDDTMRT